jgi:hypothetical protein
MKIYRVDRRKHVPRTVPDAGATEVKNWQTEDFPDPLLEDYEITVDGRLLNARVHYEDQSDPQYPNSIYTELREFIFS